MRLKSEVPEKKCVPPPKYPARPWKRSPVAVARDEISCEKVRGTKPHYWPIKSCLSWWEKVRKKISRALTSGISIFFRPIWAKVRLAANPLLCLSRAIGGKSVILEIFEIFQWFWRFFQFGLKNIEIPDVSRREFFFPTFFYHDKQLSIGQ